MTVHLRSSWGHRDGKLKASGQSFRGAMGALGEACRRMERIVRERQTLKLLTNSVFGKFGAPEPEPGSYYIDTDMIVGSFKLIAAFANALDAVARGA
mgnify:CR=1 FL=1